MFDDNEERSAMSTPSTVDESGIKRIEIPVFAADEQWPVLAGKKEKVPRGDAGGTFRG
ncbi:MAG: hypothetical protein J1E63_05190 [Muribaculaceae bacterium]|nr:hypothetical protein [Muribaculaceae bacterium]